MEIKRLIYNGTDFALYVLCNTGNFYRWEYVDGTFNNELIKDYPKIATNSKLCTYMNFEVELLTKVYIN